MSSHIGPGEIKDGEHPASLNPIDEKEKEIKIKDQDLKPKIPTSVKDVEGLEYITEG